MAHMRSLRILIDLQSCQGGSRLGGIGRYSMALAKAMIRQGSIHEFYLLLNKTLPAEQAVRDQFQGLLPQGRILTFDVPRGCAEMNRDLPKTRLAELIRERFVAQIKPDVVHVASVIEGLGDDTVTSVGELFPASRTAVTLYDLIPMVEKDRYLTNDVYKEHYFGKIDQLRKAGMLLAISEYSRREGIEVGGFPAENVANISSAVDEVFRPRQVGATRRDVLFAKYGMRRRFLMYTSSFDARKNQAGLIQAFSRLPPKLRAAYQLLIVGNGGPRVYDELRATACSCGLGKDDVLFAGHIDDEDLIDLYNLCALFVFPSLREGFGLPVLEAMSCGVPTVGASTTSVPEVLGRADAMFDPTDISSISGKIVQALTDEAFREDLRTHALRHAATFSWDNSARKALGFIEARMAALDRCNEHQIGSGAPSDAETYAEFLNKVGRIGSIADVPGSLLRAVAAAVATNEVVAAQANGDHRTPLKMGWVTTWNTRCGIATYAEKLAEQTGWETYVFAPIAQELTNSEGPEVCRCWTVGSHDLGELAEAIERSGVDAVSIQMNHGFFDFPALSGLIRRLKGSGRIVMVTLHSTVDPPPHVLDRRLSDLAPALQICDAVLIHSGQDIANLNKIGVAQNVIVFPHGVVPPIEGMPRDEQRKGGFRVGTYGFFLPHKGLEQVIEAVALLRGQGVNVELDMLNAEYSESASRDLIYHCRRLIEDRGLSSYVRVVTDFLEERDSLRRLASMDLVVFAYQDTGESSSAAVRMGLASGALVAVTPLPIFDDVADVVLRMPGTAPQELAQGIRAAMTMLTEGGKELARLRENARRWVESHQYHHLSRRLCDLVEQAAYASGGYDASSFGKF